MVERRNTGIKIWQHRSISGSLCECPFLPMYLFMHFTLGWSPIISVTFFDVFRFGVFSFCYLTVMLDGFYAFFILCNNTILSMAFLHLMIPIMSKKFCPFPFLTLSHFEFVHALELNISAFFVNLHSFSLLFSEYFFARNEDHLFSFKKKHLINL